MSTLESTAGGETEVAPDSINPDSPSPSPSSPRLGWHEGVATPRLAPGADAVPIALPRPDGPGFDLLVLAGQGAARGARLYRGTGTGSDFDAGEDLEGLGGLRTACAWPAPEADRAYLIGVEADSGRLAWIVLDRSGTSWRVTGREQMPDPLAAELGPGRVLQLCGVDWDGDGRPDLIVSYQALAGYWPEGDELPPSLQVGFNRGGGHPGYDDRGAWRGSAPGGLIAWLTSEGATGAEPPAFRLVGPIAADEGPLELSSRPFAVALPWLSRGGLELIAVGPDGGLRTWRNFGGQRPPILMAPLIIQNGGSDRPLRLPEDVVALAPAPRDSSGRARLLVGDSRGEVRFLVAEPSAEPAAVGGIRGIRGSKGKSAPRPAPKPAASEGGRESASWGPALTALDPGVRLGGRAVIAAGDLDGDGDLDLVIGDAAGCLRQADDLGTPGVPQYGLPIELEALGHPWRAEPGPDGRLLGPAEPPLGYACPAIIDWENHGRPDLLVGTASGEVLHFRNNGGGSQPRFDLPKPIASQGHPLVTPPRVRPAAADWQGTGRIDLITLDLQGRLCVYPRGEQSEVGAPVPLVDRLGRTIRLDGGYALAGRCSLWAGEFTRAGSIDILVGIGKESRFILPPLLGLPLRSVDDFGTVLLLERQEDDTLVPRMVRRADGTPLILGEETCSPAGVGAPDDADRPLLFVGSDDGSIHFFRREELTW
jgi:hypothetical protein